MIENIRKYKGLIILGLALVIFALVIGIKDDLFRSGGGGRNIMKIAGRTYNDKEFNHLGSGALELVSGLAGAGDFGLYQFLMALSTGATGRDDAAEKFFTGRIIVRNAADEFGIHPGDEEVSAHIRTMRAFADKDGKFSEETYRNFVEKGIGRLGMTEGDLRELVTDLLSYNKLNSIIASGMLDNRDAVAISQSLENQQISGEIGRLDIDGFEEKIQPTEDEVKAYWENIQDSFTTEPTRKFSYLLVTPQLPPDAAAEDEKKDSLADAAATDEQKKAKEAEKAKKAAETAEARRKKQIETDGMVDDFATKLEDQKGAGFEDLAKANGWEIKTTELFPRSKAPADLELSLRSSSRGGKAVDELFKIEPTADPLSKISQPIAVGENQWLIARLDGEEKSRPKTFEEAKDEARVQYIAEKAGEALKKAAEEARTKITSLLAGGKSFADAAKEAGIKEVKPVEKVTRSYRPDAATEPKNLFEMGRYVDPGSLAEVIVEADRAFVFLVAKREVVKDENATATLDSQVKATAGRNEISAFTDWMTARIEAANVVPLYKQK